MILPYPDYEGVRSGAPARPPRREVYRAEEIPDDLLAQIEKADLREEGRAFDHEVDDRRPA